MNLLTGREFSNINPQDDPEQFPTPPAGFAYDWEGRLIALPKNTAGGGGASTVPANAPPTRKNDGKQHGSKAAPPSTKLITKAT